MPGDTVFAVARTTTWRSDDGQSIIASRALRIRFNKTCCRWTGSPETSGNAGARSIRRRALREIKVPWSNSLTPSIRPFISTGSGLNSCFRRRARIL